MQLLPGQDIPFPQHTQSRRIIKTNLYEDAGAHEHAGLGMATRSMRDTQHEVGKIFGDLALLPFMGLFMWRSSTDGPW